MQIRNLLAATLLFSMTMAVVPAMAATRSTAKKPTTTTLTVSPTSYHQGQKGKLTVTVTPKTASGVVFVYYKQLPNGPYTSYKTIPFSKGVGTGFRTASRIGTFDIKVVYNGSSSLKPSTSNIVKVTVTK
jgi:hypothetical protein